MATYFVKQEWIFNLESMDDKLWNVREEIREGKIKKAFVIDGYKDEDEIDDLMEECNKLAWIAKSRKVTGKEYGRIKQIVMWRVNQRYAACMAAGMSEREAGACFSDV